MKINLLPNKKAVWNSTYKTFHIVALVALVFNMSSIGVFLTPNTALAKEKVPEPTVVAEKVKEKAPEPTKVVEETTDKDSCETGAKCEDTGNLRIKKYHELDAIGTPGYGSKTGSDYYMTGWYFEVTQGSVSVGNGWTGEDGDFLIIEDLPVGDYQVTETQQPGWVNSDPGVNPITKTVTVVDEDTTTYSNVWFGNTEIPGVCDLEIVKSVKNLTQSIPGNPHVSAEPGNTLEYTLTYENIGDADCTGGGVQLFDNLDSRLTFNGAHTEDNDDHDITYQGNYNGTDPVANAHVVSPGESGYVIFQAVVTDDLECGETIIPNKYRIWSTENGSQDSNIVNVNVYKECFGSLKVIKTVDFGEATPDMWEFTVPGYGTQSPAQGQDYVTFSLLPEGTYSATESNFPGYHQVSSTCDNVQVTAGQQAVCEFHNTKDTFCKMEFTKSVDKENVEPGETVEYTINYENIGDANCTGGGVKIYDDLDNRLTPVGGTLSATEYNGNGDGVTTYEVFDGSSPLANAHTVIPGESGEVTFQATVTDELKCGETIIPNIAKMWSNETGFFWSNEVEITVYRECYGSLKVIKSVDEGDATPDMWEFTVPGYGTQSPAQGQDYVTFSLLPEGTYSATESNFPGYHQVSSTCDNVQVTAGQQAVCEFHNTVDHYNFGGNKWNDLNGNGVWDQDEPGISGWTISLNANDGTPLASTVTSAVNLGQYEFTDLLPGTYQVCEAQREGWNQTYPSGNNGCHNVNLGPNINSEEMVFNFGNTVLKVEVPDISLIKEITNHNLVPGGFVEYKLTYANTGNVDLTNVYIVDDYPEQYLTISDTGGATDNGSTLTWSIGGLAIGGTGSVAYTAAIRDTAPVNVDIINIATIYSDQTDPKQDDAKIVIPPVDETNPILQITKDVNVEFANPGDTVDYTVVVTNVGDATAINVILTDVLPEGLTYPEGGTTKTFSLGDIDPGKSVTQTYDAIVGENTEAGDYVNTATADADNHDPVSDDATVEVRIPEVKGEATPELEITKEVNVEFANPGDTISYTVMVKNIGDGEAINVILTDTLPEGFVFDGTDEVVKVWNLGNMVPGAFKTVTYAVNVKDDVTPGVYENLAVVNADNADEKSAKVDVEVRAIVVLGTELPDTGTSAVDYLYYLIGIITFLIGLWTLQNNNAKKAAVQKMSLQQNRGIKL